MHLDNFPPPILDTSSPQLVQPLLFSDYFPSNLLGKMTYEKS